MNHEYILDIKAEVFFLTAFPELQEDFQGFFLDCLGTRERGRSREVLGLESKHSVLDQKVIELLGIQVSRNGIFHLLPEALFQPLTLGNASSNTYEIVAEIRKNREREQGNRRFFSPFDTEFFYFSTQLFKRQLGWPLDGDETARQMVAEIAGYDFGYSEEGSLLLLSFFANAEQAKDNAPLLTRFIASLLGLEVTITEKNLHLNALPIVALGQSKLGVDTILLGDSHIDYDDWLVEIAYSNASALTLASHGSKAQTSVARILDYFVLATRKIVVVLKALPQACSTVLGEGMLGLNIQITH